MTIMQEQPSNDTDAPKPCPGWCNGDHLTDEPDGWPEYHFQSVVDTLRYENGNGSVTLYKEVTPYNCGPSYADIHLTSLEGSGVPRLAAPELRSLAAGLLRAADLLEFGD